MSAREEATATADLVGMAVTATKVSRTANTITLAFANDREARIYFNGLEEAREVFGA